MALLSNTARAGRFTGYSNKLFSRVKHGDSACRAFIGAEKAAEAAFSITLWSIAGT
jgi:hypothetical protein